MLVLIFNYCDKWVLGLDAPHTHPPSTHIDHGKTNLINKFLWQYCTTFNIISYYLLLIFCEVWNHEYIITCSVYWSNEQLYKKVTSHKTNSRKTMFCVLYQHWMHNQISENRMEQFISEISQITYKSNQIFYWLIYCFIICEK